MNNKRNILRSLLCMAAAASMAACDNDDLYLGSADTDVLGGADGNVVYVTDAIGNSDASVFTFTGSGTFNLYAQTSKAISGNCSVTFNYNADVLEAYNAANGSNYQAVPQSMVSFGNNGVASFSAGTLKSSALPVTVSGQGQLDPETVYALPMSFTVANGAAVDGKNSMVVLLRDTSTFPGADKTYNGDPAMKLMAVLEVNGFNPLNTIGFKTATTGKQLFDIVVLFSANINYNEQTGRVYVSRNENVQAILDGRDKYLKPLQDRGMKVVLGILGNHDISGVSTLSPAASKLFAQEVKDVCDAYDLDGVFLDDEYTDYGGAQTTSNPLFQAQSYEACSRLAYDIKQAQPDRMVIGYRYQGLYYGKTIDGVQPGEFFDYVVNDYWVTSDPTETYPGLKQNQAGTGSWNCSDWSQCIPANGSWTQRFSLTGMRDEGYGTMMVYNFTNDPGYWMTSYIVNDLNKTSQAFYGEDLSYDGVFYPVDWK